jgi:hypothetical protein
VPSLGVAAEEQSTSSDAGVINPFALLNRIWQGECLERASPHPPDAHPPEAAVDNISFFADRENDEATQTTYCESLAPC